MAKEIIPLVSVIIPMYNSAKFIPQTLESLLNQTLKNFEVVVVDDCSTDNSVEVVEKFKAKFGGRLNVIKLRKNTGTPGLPRNVGIKFARGKYILFLDSDDLYTKTALAELTTLAEEYNAELIHTCNWFMLWGRKKSVGDAAFHDMNELMNRDNWEVNSEFKDSPLTAPTLQSEDIPSRIEMFTNWDTFWTSVLYMYRRDFIVRNQIFFPNMLKSEDAPFVLKCLLLAKRYLLVPNTTYIVRPRVDSVSRVNDKNVDMGKFLHKEISSLREGFTELIKVMNKSSFLREHATYHHSVLQFFHRKLFSWLYYLKDAYGKKGSLCKLDEFVRKEFYAANAPFAAYLFNTMVVYLNHLEDLELENSVLRKVQLM